MDAVNGMRYCMDYFEYNWSIISIKKFALTLVNDMIMDFIQSNASMDISSSTYVCPYVNGDTA